MQWHFLMKMQIGSKPVPYRVYVAVVYFQSERKKQPNAPFLVRKPPMLSEWKRLLPRPALFPILLLEQK